MIEPIADHLRARAVFARAGGRCHAVHLLVSQSHDGPVRRNRLKRTTPPRGVRQVRSELRRRPDFAILDDRVGIGHVLIRVLQ